MERDVYALELFIAKLLRYGVLFAGALMLLGWVSQLSFNHDVFASFRVYEEVRLADSLQKAFVNEQWGTLVAYTGLIVLVSLPLIRVLMTLLVFLKLKDFTLAAVAAVVLVGLALSITLGFEI
jgi:uncharacterized membrane protein